MGSIILDNNPTTNNQYVQLSATGPSIGGSALGLAIRAYFRTVDTGFSARHYLWGAQHTGASSGTFNHFAGLSAGVPRIFRARVPGDTSTFRHRLGAAALTANRWYNLVFNDDGNWANVNGLLIYVDGSVSTGTGAAGSYDGTIGTNGPHVLGAWGPSASQNHTNGNVQDFFLLNRPLTLAERTAFNAGAWWEDINSISASEVLEACRAIESEATVDIACRINGLNTEATLVNGAKTAYNENGAARLPRMLLHASFGDATRASITSTRCTAIDNIAGVDYASGAYAELAEASSSGPALETPADTSFGIGTVHANFSCSSTSATSPSLRHLSRADANGPVFNSQRMTVQIFACPRNNSYSNTSHDKRTIIEFGNPAHGSATPEVARIGINPSGQLFVQGTGETRTFANVYPDSGRPRHIWITLGAGAVTVRDDEGNIYSASALSAATGDGCRIGSANNTNIATFTSNGFFGDIYDVHVYDWEFDPETDFDAIEVLNVEAYEYEPAEWAMGIEGSSTLNGWLGTRNNNLVKQCLAAHRPNWRFYNGSNAGEFINATPGQYANEGALFAAAMETLGIPKARRVMLINPFAGDYQLLRATSPNASWDTEAEIVAGNIALVEAMRADYGKVIALYPIVSTGWDATSGVTGGDDEEREELLASWMSQLAPYLDGIILRPPSLRPADGTQASLDAITISSGLYGDEKHLNDDGLAEYGDATDANGWLNSELAAVLGGSIPRKLLIINGLDND